MKQHKLQKFRKELWPYTLVEKSNEEMQFLLMMGVSKCQLCCFRKEGAYQCGKPDEINNRGVDWNYGWCSMDPHSDKAGKAARLNIYWIKNES